MRPIVTGIALALLVAATLGVYAFEAAQGGGSSYLLTYPSVSDVGPTASGQAIEGQPTTPLFSVSTLNVTSLVVELSWSDDVGDPDEFELRVQNKSARSADGVIRLSFENLLPLPPQQRVLAASAEDAAARGSAPVPSGEWAVQVLLVRSPGQAPIQGVVVQQDGANDWSLSSTVSSYELDVRRG